LGQKRLFFGAYDNNEIQTILKKRLGMTGDMHDVSCYFHFFVRQVLACNHSDQIVSHSQPAIDVFETDAIRFAARKTANKSGDIRKAFHICKVAAEAVYEAITSGRRTLKDGARPIVRTEDVSAASRDMFHNTIYRAIACSTSYQALILIALGALMKNGRAKFSVREIRTKVDSISDASGEEIYDARLSFSDVLNMVTSFGQVSGLVLICHHEQCANIILM
jgi:origin recognition complex subunit 1